MNTYKQLRIDDFLLESDINSLSHKKIDFLHKITSKKGYKRYNGSPLRYGGGKSLAVGKILEFLPNNIERLVSPFMGGGSIEIAIAKELNIEVIAYDIFDLLVNYWNVQINNPKELYENLISLRNTKEEYENIKTKLKEIWNKNDGLLPNN